LIATVNPRPECANDTISTLEFANRAKQIKLSAKLNEDEYTKSGLGSTLVALENSEVVQKLKTERDALADENELLRSELILLHRNEIEMEQTLVHQQSNIAKQEHDLAKLASARDELEMREFKLTEDNCALQDRVAELEMIVATLQAQQQQQQNQRRASSVPSSARSSIQPNEVEDQYSEEEADEYVSNEEDADVDELREALEQKNAQIQELVARVANLSNQLRTYQESHCR
jgi:kinesin family protein 11